MGKKKKGGKMSGEVKTCFIAMMIFLVTGIALILYGKMWNNVSEDDLMSIQGKIVAINKVPSDNSEKTKESLIENGFSREEVDYDLEIEYEFNLDGKTHTHIRRTSYRLGENLNVGDTEELKYIIRKGEVVVDPSSNGVYTGFGYVFAGSGLIAGICGYVLKPKKGR